jgi:hypothetical protein
MRHFKRPLIVTGIVFALALVFGITAVTMIHRAKLSNREKALRAGQLGTGTAGVSLLIITPFWLLAAGKVGKERRAARDAARVPPNRKT